MGKIFNLILTLSDAAKAGRQIESATTWANRGAVVGALTVIFTFVAAALSVFGVIPDGAITADEIKTIALGFSGVGCTVLSVLHQVTNPNTGK